MHERRAARGVPYSAASRGLLHAHPRAAATIPTSPPARMTANGHVVPRGGRSQRNAEAVRRFPPGDDPKLVSQREDAAIAIAMAHRELAEQARHATACHATAPRSPRATCRSHAANAAPQAGHRLIDGPRPHHI